MSSSSVSPDLSENPNFINSQNSVGESPENHSSPQDVEEHNVNQENSIPSEDYDTENDEEDEEEEEDEEDEEDEEEEESVNMPPPPQTNTSLRIRYDSSTVPPAPAAPAPPSPGTAASSNHIPIPTYDPYHPPGFAPLPTYPWLAHEIEKQERKIQSLEERIGLYPKHYQMEKVISDVYHIKHAILELKTRLPIVAEEKFYGDRISKLENDVDQMKAKMDAMQFIIRELCKNQK